MDHTGGQSDAMHFIAEGITALAGFEVAAISIVDGAEIYTAAVAGSREAAAELMQLRTPVDALLAELASADEWGTLRFLPHERASDHLDGFEWVPDQEVDDVSDAWHPRDMLCALLHDGDGRLRGVLSVDLPRNGRRPAKAQREILEVYAGFAQQAVVNFVERDELARDLEVQRSISHYRGQLIDVLSHEVQTPTSAIIGRAEVALDDEGDPEQRQHLEVILRAALRISAMAEDLLVMGRVDNVDRPLPTSPVDVAGIVRDAHALLREEAARRDVELTIALDETPTATIGDAEELDAVVSNLVSNAIKYSDPGGRVLISTHGSDDDQVSLVVSDEGIGISEEDQVRLFEEFYRSPSATARERPGNGLGLAIVDRIVRRHRGHIVVDSTLGVGTLVRVVLPAARLASDA